MDNITHALLGGAIAYALVGKRIGPPPLAFFIGALAATVPDFDVFIRTGDELLNRLLHRHFTHALILAPILAAITILPFLRSAKVREHWPHVYLAALAACAGHSLLDMLTSYGTMILWPFTQHRFALDYVVILDLFYSLTLLIGVALAWRWKSPKTATITLLLSTMYLSFGAIQHERAITTQQKLMALRGHTKAEEWRVLPQIGVGMNYRSIYMYQGRLYADAIRVTPFAEAQVREGTSVELVKAKQMDWNKRFWDFADYFVARIPESPEMLGDMRYTLTPEGFDAFWGISENGGQWQSFMQSHRQMVSRLWNELVRPSGYVPLSTVQTQ